MIEGAPGEQGGEWKADLQTFITFGNNEFIKDPEFTPFLIECEIERAFPEALES